MSEIARIADQFKRSINGDPWHGPNIMDVIADLTAAEAASKRLEKRHSVWEILNHITAWIEFVNAAINDTPMPSQLKKEEDWPPVDVIFEKAWQDSKNKCLEAASQFIISLSKKDDSLLEKTVPGRSYDYYYLLHGITQHNIYHAGQMAALKK